MHLTQVIPLTGNNLRQLAQTHASVTKQYNLLPVTDALHLGR